MGPWGERPVEAWARGALEVGRTSDLALEALADAWLLPDDGSWAAGDVTPKDCADLVKHWTDADEADRTVTTGLRAVHRSVRCRQTEVLGRPIAPEPKLRRP